MADCRRRGLYRLELVPASEVVLASEVASEVVAVPQEEAGLASEAASEVAAVPPEEAGLASEVVVQESEEEPLAVAS